MNSRERKGILKVLLLPFIGMRAKIQESLCILRAMLRLQISLKFKYIIVSLVLIFLF